MSTPLPDPHTFQGRMTLSPRLYHFLSEFVDFIVRSGEVTQDELHGSQSSAAMYIYSSLSPTKLWERGAELRETILSRWPRFESPWNGCRDGGHDVLEGPTIPLSMSYGFGSPEYSAADLAHHALMHVMQFELRYPELEHGQNASFHIASPELPNLSKSELRSRFSKAVKLMEALFDEEGGLHPDAVGSFAGRSDTHVALLIQAEDALAVLKAHQESEEAEVRFMPYDTSISPARNEWRQAGFWSQEVEELLWHTLTTHYLSVEQLMPEIFGAAERAKI